MARPRPKRALRAPLAMRVARYAVPGLVVAVATTGVVTAATGSASQKAVPVPTAVVASTTAPIVDREARITRGALGTRTALPSPSPAAKEKPKETKEKKAEVKPKPAPPKPKAPPLRVVGTKYTRVDLNVRSANDPDSKLLTVLKSGSKLSVTATVRDNWRYISYRGTGAWVKNQYLVDKKPVVAKAAPSSAACRGGSRVESGLTPDAIRVHRAICNRFPAIKSFGGVRADSLPEHPSGRALDAMISGSAGWEVARWVRANAKQLGVSEVLYSQQIWTVQRSGEGWRSFSNRGSATANHYDHVHISVYGNAGR